MAVALLIVVSFFVVRGGEDTQWRLINFLIIFGVTALGLAGTLVIERSIEFPEDFTETLTRTVGILSGFIGCFIAGAWNYWRTGAIYKGKKHRETNNDKSVV